LGGAVCTRPRGIRIRIIFDGAAAATAASPEIVPAKPFAARAQADAVTAVAGMERAFARLSAPEMAGFYFVPPVWYFP
jgi:hypothetical protein